MQATEFLIHRKTYLFKTEFLDKKSISQNIDTKAFGPLGVGIFIYMFSYT